MNEDQRKRLRKFILDCSAAGKVFSEKPGLAGPGANAEVIIDLYLSLAELAEIVARER
jgi:hypothetical protein